MDIIDCKSNLLNRLFECMRCGEECINKIHMCGSGHLVCNACSDAFGEGKCIMCGDAVLLSSIYLQLRYRDYVKKCTMCKYEHGPMNLKRHFKLH